MITWASIAGKIYKVAYKAKLSDPTWTDLSGNLTAVSTAMSWADVDATKSAMRYYTVYVTN